MDAIVLGKVHTLLRIDQCHLGTVDSVQAIYRNFRWGCSSGGDMVAQARAKNQDRECSDKVHVSSPKIR